MCVMNEYTPGQFIELLKVLHCMSLDEFCDMFERNIECDPGDYISGKYLDMKNDMFEWLCQLDSGNQRLVFDYAAKKAEWSALKR